MKRLLIVLLLALIIAGVIYLVFFLKISKVTCESQYGPCSPHVGSNLSEAENKSILNSKKKVSEILNENKYVGEFRTQFSFPNRLKVRILEKKGYIAVASSLDSEYQIVDNSGTVLEQSSETVLPKLLLYEQEKLSAEQIAFASDLLNVLFRWKDIKVAHVSLEGIKIDLDSSNRVLLPLEGDKDVLMGSVRYILSWLNTNPQGSRIEIDLRYKNPVIRKI